MKRWVVFGVGVVMSAGFIVATTDVAHAFPSLGGSCDTCHGPSGGGTVRDGALQVTGEKLLDLGTQLDGNQRGELQTFTAMAGDTVALTVDVLDGSEDYAVELKGLDSGGQKNSQSNTLAGYTPDPSWTAQQGGAYYTTAPTSWDGNTDQLVFNLTLAPDTPIDVYDLEFAVAGTPKFYADQHFYLEVVPVPEPVSLVLVGLGLVSVALLASRRRRSCT